MNCDTVVTSRWGSLFGVPVSIWAMVFYALLFALSLRASGPASSVRDRSRADVFALAVAGGVFSAYLAVVSLAVLNTMCLLCAGLYVVAAVAVVAAWRQASPLAETFARLRERWNQVRRRPMMATAALAVAGGVLLFSGGWLGAQTRLTREQVFRSNPQFYDWYTNQPVVDPTLSGGTSQGAENAPIQLVEFSDFECPHCAQAYVTLKDILPRYQDRVRFTHYNFPLSSDCNPAVQQKGHEHACQAAAAALCAGEAGKFQPYANLLFANQTALGDKALVGYAKQVGLDVGAFETCLGSKQTTEKVADEAETGQKMGVRSTPTFFINGRKIEG
ncbi:MAG: thioredoxin domain-containing protein, partial [Candidatus Binatia bacterium]